jgi:hypothetical protein
MYAKRLRPPGRHRSSPEVFDFAEGGLFKTDRWTLSKTYGIWRNLKTPKCKCADAHLLMAGADRAHRYAGCPAGPIHATPRRRERRASLADSNTLRCAPDNHADRA